MAVMKPTRFLLKSLFKGVLAWRIDHRTKRAYGASKSIGGCARWQYRYWVR